jgi:aconitate hydratase
MGVIPLELQPGATWQSPGLTGEEIFDIPDLDDHLQPGSKLTVHATAPGGKVIEFQATTRIDTPVELEYYRNGGILQTVLRKLLAGT